MKRYYTFMQFTNLLINLDHGIIPAAAASLEKDLNLKETSNYFLKLIIYSLRIDGIFSLCRNRYNWFDRGQNFYKISN
jgi:hypothetical protein